ncbi:MAG: bifunctional nuclease family protein [FCB group bacterium]|nr:bifunctional nuclease family protein [FCB group bacterium]
MSEKNMQEKPWDDRDMIPVEVAGISVCPPYQGYVVILEEKAGERRLPIFIGVAEAQAISILLQGMEYARPLTFDLFGQILDSLEVRVEGIRVTKLVDNTFFAVITFVDDNGRVSYVDARPSDSIALALKTKAPIYVSAKVLSTAAIQLDQMPETGIDAIEELKKQLHEAVALESYEEAAKIRDKIRELEKKTGGKKKS